MRVVETSQSVSKNNSRYAGPLTASDMENSNPGPTMTMVQVFFEQRIVVFAQFSTRVPHYRLIVSEVSRAPNIFIFVGAYYMTCSVWGCGMAVPGLELERPVDRRMSLRTNYLQLITCLF